MAAYESSLPINLLRQHSKLKWWLICKLKSTAGLCGRSDLWDMTTQLHVRSVCVPLRGAPLQSSSAASFYLWSQFVCFVHTLQSKAVRDLPQPVWQRSSTILTSHVQALTHRNYLQPLRQKPVSGYYIKIFNPLSDRRSYLITSWISEISPHVSLWGKDQADPLGTS